MTCLQIMQSTYRARNTITPATTMFAGADRLVQRDRNMLRRYESRPATGTETKFVATNL